MEWAMPWPGAELGVEAEQAGCRAFCSGEFANQHAYLGAAEIAGATSTALLGPGIAYAFARSPFVHSSALRHLWRTAPDRLFLALGAGTPRMNRDWFATAADHPSVRMKEMIGAIRAYLSAENGDVVDSPGEYYPIKADIRAPILGAIDVPLLIGAFNRVMLRTVGETADGVLGHPLFTDQWWDEVVTPELAEGARAAGRDARELRRWGWVITAIDADDPERARTDARRQIAFYLTVKTYDSLVELHGWQSQVRAIRESFASGDTDAMAASVSDDMLSAIAVCGTPAEAESALRARHSLPDIGFTSAPAFLVGRRRNALYVSNTIALMSRIRS